MINKKANRVLFWIAMKKDITMINLNYWIKRFAIISVLLISVSNVMAQTQINHNTPAVLERNTALTLEFELLGVNVQDIQEVFFNYRYDEGIAYQSVRAEIAQNKVLAKVTFDNPDANSVQYFIQINMIGDVTLYYPTAVLETNKPISVVLVEPKKVEDADISDLSGSTSSMDFSILSPLPNERIVPEDALVALTLFYNEGEASADSIKIIFDGVDVTSKATVTPYLITYKPENLQPGDHSVKIEYSFNGEKTSLADWVFPTLDPTKVAVVAGESRYKNWAKGFAELSARNQAIFGVQEDIYKSTFRVSGSEKWFKYSLNGMFTTQEDPRLQPQNRYGIELYMGRWFEFQAGHIFPRLNPLILAGNRVFGINTSVKLFDRLINFQYVAGEMRRPIENLYQSVVKEDVVLGRDPDGVELTEPRYVLQLQDNGTGTYRRKVMGGRFALGNGDNFQWGFNSMTVRDDVNSITAISDYESLIQKRPDLLLGSQLTDVERQELSQYSDSLFQIKSGLAAPRDNFMFASDMVIKMFKNRVTVRSDVGFSLLNNDISTGVLNTARGDEIGIDIPSNVGNILDELSWLIIINENLSYLPVEIDTSGKISPVKNTFLGMKDSPVPTGLMASQNSINMNFFGNNFQAKYQWVGPEYRTLSNTAMRRDIDGYSLSDRFRLISNQIYVTLGTESFRDNLIGQKESTTRTKIYNSDLSLYPNNRKWPRLSVGFRMQNRDNGVLKFNPYVRDSGQDELSALRNLAIIEGDTVVIATPRLDKTLQYSFNISQEVKILGMRNDLNLNIMNIKTSDEVYRYGSFESQIYNFGISTNWNQLPLKTTLNFSLNNSSGANGLSKVDILGLNIGANYFMFDEKLSLFADLAFTNNSIKSVPLVVNDNGTTDDVFDDFYTPDTDAANTNNSEQNTYIFRGGASYNYNQFHSFIFDASYTNVSVLTEGISIPNDYLVQLRYVFRF